MATILITDGQQRKSLSATRSLGRAGHRVLVAEVTRFATARFSRYAAQGLLCPDPQADPDRFDQWLRATVKQYGVDCVLPMDDATTERLIAAGPTLGAATLLPSEEQFRATRNKGETVGLARRAGVRLPRTTYDLGEALRGDLGWPVVVKARRSSGARGIRRASDPEALVTALHEITATDLFPILQEYIPPGRKFDICLLYNRSGQLVTSFVQEELRGYPLWGGPSTLQESVDRPDLVQTARRLLEPIGWTGPVEVEFMEDPRTGEPVLMEINPRFWASLDLSVRCGIDFPLWTAALALGGEVAPPESYPTGRRCRWLLPGDILHFFSSPDRFRMEPSVFRPLDARTHDDILSRDDPMPAIGFVLAVLRYLFDSKMWRMIIR